MIYARLTVRFIVACAFVLVLASCAKPRAARPITTTTAIHTIGLVSTVPNAIATRYDEVLAHEDTVVEPVPWDLHGKSLRAASAYLNGAYQVTAADIDSTSLGTIDLNIGFEELQRALKNKLGTRKYDLVLVIAPMSRRNTAASLWHSALHGYEIAFSYMLLAMDGDTFDINGIGYSGQDSWMRTAVLDWHGEPIGLMSGFARQTVENAVDQFIRANIPLSLATLGLAGNSPPSQ